MKFVKVIIPTPLKRSFDYLPPTNVAAQDILTGTRVLVPFGSREVVGIVWGYSNSTDIPESKIKQIKEIIDTKPIITKPIITLVQAAANYYHHSIGEIVMTGLPMAIRKGKPFEFVKPQTQEIILGKKAEHVLSQEQKISIETINKNLKEFSVFLLEGITGSGKTEVYLQAIANALEQGLSAMVSVWV